MDYTSQFLQKISPVAVMLMAEFMTQKKQPSAVVGLKCAHFYTIYDNYYYLNYLGR